MGGDIAGPEKWEQFDLRAIGLGRDGLMKPTAYDTAWLARIPAEHDNRAPAFPEALKWLRTNQHDDGSWGAEIEYTHDRIISTMAAILALAEWDEGNASLQEDKHIIERGIRYIWGSASHLAEEQETIGFEVILPTLFERCQELGFKLPMEAFERYGKMRAEKMAKIPADMRYSRNTTLAFSLEFVGDELDIEKAQHIQECDGSVAVSPSATAYFLTKWPDNAAARRYINAVATAYGSKAPQVFPFDIFETDWSLWNLFLASIPLDQHVVRPLKRLKAVWDRGQGVGHSSNHSVPNADDSAMAFRVLTLAGFEPDPRPLFQFERDEYFICYPFERNPSTSTNIHMVEALKGLDDARATKAARWLRSAQMDGGYWMDKWHASPYYPTGHAVIALCDVDDGLAKSAVQWILETQQPCGCWGFYDSPSAEETAYCLQALCVYDRTVEPVERDILARGREGLLALGNESPSLWIGKCLYTPVHVVKSAVYSALAMTRGA